MSYLVSAGAGCQQCPQKTLQALVAGHTVEGREAPGYAGKPRELAAGALSQRKGV